MIRLSSVSHQIDGAKILSNISANIPKGQVTALIGPNGAGKSTLLSLIARLQGLEQGSISIDDLDVVTTPSDELARKLAILTQSNSITARLRVRELVAFGRFPHHKGRPNHKDLERIEEAIEQFDLGDLADKFLDEVSGGQRQKAFVAMAYAQDTDYLLLDEPLNNLDMASARNLMRNLTELAAQTGKTIVIVLHEINYAALYANWIMVLKQGQLIANGPAKEILTPQIIADTFGIEVTIHEIDGKTLVMHYG
ncbi:MAG: ATP-binding cassette domain-containing protein [Cohaesibacter sp.]|nr:ATP-binding cassette domain-containing protein [Cohaesibacter sp.]